MSTRPECACSIRRRSTTSTSAPARRRTDCAAGLEAVLDASREIAVGDADLTIAGGVESMSRAPWVVATPELVRRGGGYGLATMCIGVGQGIAVVVHRERSTDSTDSKDRGAAP